MTINLRGYQSLLESATYVSWNAGHKVVVMRLDTGGGKTAILAKIVSDHNGASCVIAHRHEIVAQLSLMLAKYSVRHNVIAAKKTRERIVALHVKVLGQSFLDPNARCTVASVDTLVKRDDLTAWAMSVTLWIVDEGHHLVEDNKWHTVISRFANPACRGLLPTATPKRADGRGLGSPEIGGDGVATAMVEGPPMRWLIEEGYLTDYEMVLADSHMVELLGEVGKSGDWSTAQLRAANEQSPIVGDVVRTYLNVDAGRMKNRRRVIPAVTKHRTGIVFTPDTTTAAEVLAGLRANGFIAELVTGETDPGVRAKIFDHLETGQIDVVVVVDIVSEGTDLPALITGAFARATASLATYMQQFGRLLRPLPTPAFLAARTREERLAAIAASAKPFAIVIDHVGNFLRHGPPDRPRVWSLQSTSRRSGPSDAIPHRACLNVECAQAYERYMVECPYCGTPAPPPAARSAPGMVEGDMAMLDPEVLAALRGEVDAAIMTLDEYRAKLAATGLPQTFIWKNAKSHAGKIEGQEALRSVMEWWGGVQHAKGLKDREMQKLFFIRFGVDVYSAQALGPVDAATLMEKIAGDFTVA